MQNLAQNGWNDASNNNNSTQVVDSNSLHQGGGGSVKQLDVIDDVNTSCIAAPVGSERTHTQIIMMAIIKVHVWTNSQQPQPQSQPQIIYSQQVQQPSTQIQTQQYQQQHQQHQQQTN
ncbi:18444_t:CDS:2, partial [Entrophospora sp. SA101]